MEKIRISLLSVIFGSVACVLVRAIFAPAAKQATHTPFAFPAAVPLAEWQWQQSKSIESSAKNSHYLAGKHYRYIRHQQTLEINMWYEVDSRGNMQSFLHNYFSQPLNSGQISGILRQQPKIGYYQLFTYQHRAYLSSCINSHGGSTVTVSQFRHNRYSYDLLDWRFKERIMPWLQGRVSMLDTRCLWTQMSLPVKDSAEVAYQSLEKAWVSWYQWWYPRFPQP